MAANISPKVSAHCCVGSGLNDGLTYRENAQFGFRPIAGKVQLYDLYAMMPHLRWLNHDRLTFCHNGRDYRLTDVFDLVV